MKISKFGRSRDRVASKSQSQASFTIKHSPFLETLQQQKENLLDIDAAVEAVDEYSKALRRNPNFENLYRYKQAVRIVLTRLVKAVYSVEDKVSYDPYGRRRLYVMVEQVDTRLEELTRLFLRKEVPSLELARRLDEIRGMVLDLYT